MGEGVVVIAPAPREGDPPSFEERRYSERYTCPYDGFTIEELEPRSFSFNSPHGACPACTGLGTRLEIDPERLLPDRSRSIKQGAFVAWSRMPMEESWRGRIMEAVAKSHGWRVDVPVSKLPPEAIQHLLYAPRNEKVVIGYRHERGENTYVATFEGLVPQSRAPLPRNRIGVHQERARALHDPAALPHVPGRRLKPEVLAVTVDGRNISDAATMSVTECSPGSTVSPSG